MWQQSNTNTHIQARTHHHHHHHPHLPDMDTENIDTSLSGPNPCSAIICAGGVRTPRCTTATACSVLLAANSRPIAALPLVGTPSQKEYAWVAGSRVDTCMCEGGLRCAGMMRDEDQVTGTSRDAFVPITSVSTHLTPLQWQPDGRLALQCHSPKTHDDGVH